MEKEKLIRQIKGCRAYRYVGGYKVYVIPEMEDMLIIETKAYKTGVIISSVRKVVKDSTFLSMKLEDGSFIVFYKDKFNSTKEE